MPLPRVCQIWLVFLTAEEVVVVVAAPQGDLPDAHQAVPEVEQQGVLQAVAGPEVLLHLVVLAGLRVVPQQVRQ
jgi:hypothetical protein